MDKPTCMKCGARPGRKDLMGKFCCTTCAVAYALRTSGEFEWCRKHKGWFNNDECSSCWYERKAKS